MWCCGGTELWLDLNEDVAERGGVSRITDYNEGVVVALDQFKTFNAIVHVALPVAEVKRAGISIRVEVVAALPDSPQVNHFEHVGWLPAEIAWRKDL